MRKFLLALLMSCPLLANATPVTTFQILSGGATYSLMNFTSVPAGSIAASGGLPAGYVETLVNNTTNYYSPISAVEQNAGAALVWANPVVYAVPVASIGTGNGQIAPDFQYYPSITLTGYNYQNGGSNPLTYSLQLPMIRALPVGYVPRYWYDNTSPAAHMAIGCMSTGAVIPHGSGVIVAPYLCYAIPDSAVQVGDVMAGVPSSLPYAPAVPGTTEFMLPAGYVAGSFPTAQMIPQNTVLSENRSPTFGVTSGFTQDVQLSLSYSTELSGVSGPLAGMPLPNLSVAVTNAKPLLLGQGITSEDIMYMNLGYLMQAPGDDTPLGYDVVSVCAASNCVDVAVRNTDVGPGLTYAPSLVIDSNLSGTVTPGPATNTAAGDWPGLEFGCNSDCPQYANGQQGPLAAPSSGWDAVYCIADSNVAYDTGNSVCDLNLASTCDPGVMCPAHTSVAPCAGSNAYNCTETYFLDYPPANYIEGTVLEYTCLAGYKFNGSLSSPACSIITGGSTSNPPPGGGGHN